MVKRYGKARLVGGIRVFHEFDNTLEAYEWHLKMTKGWRRHFVTEIMIYADRDCTRRCLQGFDMLAMRCDIEDFGFHTALENARQLKYGTPIPELFKPKENETTEVVQ